MSKASWRDGLKNMLDFIYGLPEQLEYFSTLDLMLPRSSKEGIRHIVVAGMGGSAIGGDVLRCCLRSSCPVAVWVNRDYGLPAFVGEDCLVFAVSYSGNTEETLASFEAAKRCKANLVAVTSGGELAKRAQEEGIPLIRIPQGLPPRAALGYLFAPLAKVVESLGLVQGLGSDLQEAVAVLKRMRDDLSGPGSEAQLVAEKLKGKIPVIWGVSPLLEAACMRWKAQINENAKSPAFSNCFPELNHNEFVGVEEPKEILEKVAVVLLRDLKQEGQNLKRMINTQELLQTKIKEFVTVNSRGESELARVFSLMYFGDYVSVYLAAGYEVDPVPVFLIEELKKRLKEN